MSGQQIRLSTLVRLLAWGLPLLVALVTLGVHSLATAQDQKPIDSSALRSVPYEGVWSGPTRCLFDPGLASDNECDRGLTLDIQGESLAVQQSLRNKRGGEVKQELNAGRFQFIRLSTNAVATANNSGTDEDGDWVETWTFIMTIKDPDTMIVHWTRVVNNLDLPLDNKASKFSAAGMGELKRAR